MNARQLIEQVAYEVKALPLSVEKILQQHRGTYLGFENDEYWLEFPDPDYASMFLKSGKNIPIVRKGFQQDAYVYLPIDLTARTY